MISEAQTRLAHYIASQGIWSYKGVVKLMEARNNDKVSDLKELARISGLDCKLEQSSMKPEYDNNPYYIARLVKENECGIFSDALWAWYSRKSNPQAMELVKSLGEKLAAKNAATVTTEQKITWKADFRHFMADRASRLIEGSPFAEK